MKDRIGSIGWIPLLLASIVLLVVAGCGGQEEATNHFLTSGPAAAATPATDLARLVKFWALDRYDLDNQQVMDEYMENSNSLLAKAQVDECFNGIGEQSTLPPCASGIPKTNQAYVWGLVRSGKQLFFGTVANTLCFAEDLVFDLASPQQTSKWVCEFDKNAAGMQDWRPPQMYRYDTGLGKLYSLDTGAFDKLRNATVGFRSAGTAGGVAFIAGPALDPRLGIVIFAYDAANGALLGAQAFPQWSNIRSWVTLNGVLYAGVGNTLKDCGGPGGSILRWTGTKSTDLAKLFKFDVVGVLDAEGANLAVHKGRIYVTTWPVFCGPGARFMGLYRSPVIPSTGLTTANQADWKQIWNVTQYEPDLAVAATYGGGALASFDGRLFFGTMHVPFFGAYSAIQFYGNDMDMNDPAVLAGLAMGGHRSPTIFQGWNLETTKPAFRILYGETFLPRYDPAVKRFTIAYDDFHRNGMKQAPVFGASGFGWFFNAYVWAMEPFAGQLYIGTFDWSQLARVGLQTLMPANALASDMEASFLKEIDGKIPWEGADLFRFWSATNKAEVEAVNGLGNDTNYGIRTFAHDDKNLYVGTANAMNLDPRGGWELRRLTWYTP